MITIEEAIETLADILRYVKPGDPPEEHDAIGLGIGALKAIRQLRTTPIVHWIDQLPGETNK